MKALHDVNFLTGQILGTRSYKSCTFQFSMYTSLENGDEDFSWLKRSLARTQNAGKVSITANLSGHQPWRQ
jgi:hypothetical protein